MNQDTNNEIRIQESCEGQDSGGAVSGFYHNSFVHDLLFGVKWPCPPLEAPEHQ